MKPLLCLPLSSIHISLLLVCRAGCVNATRDPLMKRRRAVGSAANLLEASRNGLAALFGRSSGSSGDNKEENSQSRSSHDHPVSSSSVSNSHNAAALQDPVDEHKGTPGHTGNNEKANSLQAPLLQRSRVCVCAHCGVVRVSATRVCPVCSPRSL